MKSILVSKGDGVDSVRMEERSYKVLKSAHHAETRIRDPKEAKVTHPQVTSHINPIQSNPIQSYHLASFGDRYKVK